MSNIPKKHCLTFIGMSGVGKTTFGKKVAKEWNFTFIDTDSIIEKTIQQSISDYINQKKENSFLKKEEDIICNTIFEAPCIISTGGSVIYSEKIMKHLKQCSSIIYLNDSLDNIS